MNHQRHVSIMKFFEKIECFFKKAAKKFTERISQNMKMCSPQIEKVMMVYFTLEKEVTKTIESMAKS